MHEGGITERIEIGKMWGDQHLTRKIVLLRTDDWVRVIALVSMIQSGSFIIGAGAVIVGRLFGYDILPTDSSILYLLVGMTVGIFGLFLGMYLYDGVEEKNPNKLLAWIFYAGFVLTLLSVDLCIYFGYYPINENWQNIFGIFLCLLIYSVFIIFVNIHRQQLIAIVNDNKQRNYRQRHRLSGGEPSSSSSLSSPSSPSSSSAENSENRPVNLRSKENGDVPKIWLGDEVEVEIGIKSQGGGNNGLKGSNDEEIEMQTVSLWLYKDNNDNENDNSSSKSSNSTNDKPKSQTAIYRCDNHE